MNKRTIARIILAVFAFLFAFSAFAWDAHVICAGMTDVTISEQTYYMCKEYPIIAFTLGVVIGHLCWPVKRLKEKHGNCDK